MLFSYLCICYFLVYVFFIFLSIKRQMPIYVFYDVCMALWFNYIDIKKVESKNGSNKKQQKQHCYT